MPSGYGSYWGRLTRTQKVFLAFIAVYIALYFSHLAPTARSMAGICAVLTGLAAAFQLVRRGLRTAIWRLRNRLLVAYVFIAVVPLILVVALVTLSGYVVIGQMAVYLVNKELENRELQLQRAAMAMARFPASNPEVATNRTADIIRHSFPEFDMIASGEHVIRFPKDTTLTHPPSAWGERALGGLILRETAAGKRLYAWAHAAEGKSDITIDRSRLADHHHRQQRAVLELCHRCQQQQHRNLALRLSGERQHHLQPDPDRGRRWIQTEPGKLYRHHRGNFAGGREQPGHHQRTF